VGSTLPQVALWGPCGTIFAINEQHVAMMLSYPRRSLEGSCARRLRRIGHSPEKEVLY
jgi:hypothetical protein